MDLRDAFIVLADISGYTRFIRMHRMSLLHAERIIDDLLESVVATAEHPLVLSEIEGDAAFFYAWSDGTPAMARDIFGQVRRFFEAFRAKMDELVNCNVCQCDGCLKAAELKLKAVLHHGEVTLRRVRAFEKPAGEQVILAHRLLKNSIGHPEYILMSEAFRRLCPAEEGGGGEARVEACEGIGPVNVTVYYPAGAPPSTPRRYPITAKVRQLLRIEWHTIQRRMGWRKAPVYKSLVGV